MDNAESFARDHSRDSTEDRNAVRAWIAQADNSSVSRNRYQVLETFPLLVLEIARGIRSQACEAISTAIDHGWPLIDTISTSLRVRKETARFLRGKKLSLVGAPWVGNPFLLFRIIDNLPRHRWPASPHDWMAFTTYWEGVQQATWADKTVSERRDLRWHMFHGLCSMGYRQAERRLLRFWPETIRWEEIRSFIECLEIWAWHQAGQLNFNIYVAAEAEVRISSELLMRYPVIKIHELAKRWHYVFTFSAIRGMHRDTPQWPALLPTPIQVDDLSVVSLVTRSDLLDETDTLKHCVWRYTQQCVRGNVHIVSIQNSQGDSLSTAEIQLKIDSEGIPTPVLIQHRAKRNEEPAVECQRAIAIAMTELSDTASPFWIGRVAEDLLEWQREIDARLGECPELTVYEGLCICLEDTLPDYSEALVWLTRRLENAEGLYRHRNDQAGETLTKVGLGNENSDQRYFDLGYFDPTVFEELEQMELALKGKNHPYASWAESWKVVPFWYFHYAHRV